MTEYAAVRLVFRVAGTAASAPVPTSSAQPKRARRCAADQVFGSSRRIGSFSMSRVQEGGRDVRPSLAHPGGGPALRCGEFYFSSRQREEREVDADDELSILWTTALR